MTIKDLRTKYGMTQQQFADFCELPKSTIEEWENGVSECPQDAITKIAFVLETAHHTAKTAIATFEAEKKE